MPGVEESEEHALPTTYFLCPFSFLPCGLSLCPNKTLGPKYLNLQKNFAIKSSSPPPQKSGSLYLPACSPLPTPSLSSYPVPHRHNPVSHQVSALVPSLLFISRIRWIPSVRSELNSAHYNNESCKRLAFQFNSIVL